MASNEIIAQLRELTVEIDPSDRRSPEEILNFITSLAISEAISSSEPAADVPK